MPEEQGNTPAATTDVGLRTPEEHAAETGNIRRVPTAFGGATESFTPEHRAAAVLHGWTVHNLHTAAPLRFSRDAYIAALRAAFSADTKGNYAPHAPAESPYSPFKTATPAA